MRHERSGERDLTINLWHRATFGDEAKALDLDLVGMCHRCDQPLYAWEATRSTLYKPTKWLRRITSQQNVPGYLVTYAITETEKCPHCGRPAAATRYDPTRLVSSSVFLEIPFQSRRLIGDLGDFERHLWDLRRSHDRLWHFVEHHSVEEENALFDEMRATDQLVAYRENGDYGQSEAPF
jgi:hypothetical protein